MSDTTLGQRLARARVDAGLNSVGQMANLSGIAKADLQQAETVQSKADIDETIFDKMIDHYGMEKMEGGVEWILNGGDHPLDTLIDRLLEEKRQELIDFEKMCSAQREEKIKDLLEELN